jgi:hypothetical protein
MVFVPNGCEQLGQSYYSINLHDVPTHNKTNNTFLIPKLTFIIRQIILQNINPNYLWVNNSTTIINNTV